MTGTPNGRGADTRETDVQCARCGSSIGYEDCWSCGGEGGYEDDQDGYVIDRTCDECGGRGIQEFCLSSADWCEANPLPGRERTERHTVETFVIPADPTPEPETP